MCETFQKHLYKNKILIQVVYNKMTLDLLHNEFNILKKIQKFRNSSWILFKKIATTHGKGNFL